ncbi:guanylate kinase, partial [Metarhizium majus ARSEF 297]
MAVSTSDPQPIVISGPSGVGKSTLCQMLQEAHPNVFATTVSHTTRERRPGEVEGQSYFYVSRDKFESLIRQHTFVEHTEFNGNLYGTSKQTVIDQTAKGSTVILDIEMEGVKQLKQELLKPNPPIRPRFVFIQPPSFEVLEERLRGRGTETESSVQKRLNQAKAELEYAQTGAHDIIITNRDLTEAFKELENFIFTTV